MAKLSTFTVLVFISTAFNAVCGNPGFPHLHRVVRSPHYGSFDFHPHPLPYPLFQTNNWSGIAKSSDGSAQGLFSGAAATATNSGSATGQAVSLASADCDDENSAQTAGSAGKSEVQKSDDISGGFGGHFSAHKEAHYSYQSGGGKIEAQGSGFSGQDTLENQGKSGSASAITGQNSGDGQIQFGGVTSSDQGNHQSHSGAAINSHEQSSLFSQGKSDREQGVELINEGLHRGNNQGQNQEQGSFVTSSQSAGLGQQKELTGGFGHQNGGYSQQSTGFGQYTDVGFGQQKENNGQQNVASTQQGDGFSQLKEQGNGGISHQGFSHESSGGLGVQGGSFGKYSGGFEHQNDFEIGQHREQSGGFGQQNGGFGQLKQQTGGFGQQGQLTGGFGGFGSNSQSSSFALGRGIGGGYPGYDHSGYGRNFGHGYGFEHGYGGGNGFDSSQLQANTDAEFKQQQQQSGSELASSITGASGATQSTSAKDQTSAIGGALNLASQGLDAAQNAGCSTCDRKGGYAFSNAKSHSGSAIAVSIGG